MGEMGAHRWAGERESLSQKKRAKPPQLEACTTCIFYSVRRRVWWCGVRVWW